MTTKEDKHAKFQRLATKRINTVFEKMHLIKKLANRNNYEWTEEEIDAMLKALHAGVDDIEKRFKRKEDLPRTFSFEEVCE